MSETFLNPAVIEMSEARISALRDPSLTVLEAVNWSVQPGEFWVLAGGQHSGKSDLLMHAACLMAPQRGSIRVFGEAQLKDRLRVGLVFAGGRLFNQLTVAENVALPLRYQSDLPSAEVARAVETLLKLLELTPFTNSSPASLPTNWRQRTALARALILQPELLLLDNPLAGLDARHRAWTLQFLDQLWRGHAHFGGRAMTLAVTTGDLRAWAQPERKFAVLSEKSLTVLGAWNECDFTRHHAAKELLAGPDGTTI